MRLIFGLNNDFYDRPAVVCGVLRFSDLPETIDKDHDFQDGDQDTKVQTSRPRSRLRFHLLTWATTQ